MGAAALVEKGRASLALASMEEPKKVDREGAAPRGGGAPEGGWPRGGGAAPWGSSPPGGGGAPACGLKTQASSQ